MESKRCSHNNWAIHCDTCELESLRARHAAVCDELEQVSSQYDELASRLASGDRLCYCRGLDVAKQLTKESKNV